MKFLKTIRFDPSDTQVFEHAASPDEWSIPGGFSFSGVREGELSGKPKQAFSNGFLSLESFGHSTFVSVTQIEKPVAVDLATGLAQYFVTHFAAPSLDEARPAAEDEIQFVMDMCANVAINSIFTLRRLFNETGEISEQFRIIEAPYAKPHAQVWEVVED